jgi:hypothetical protein
MFGNKKDYGQVGDESEKGRDHGKLSFKEMMSKASEYVYVLVVSYRLTKKVGEGASSMGKGMMSKLSVGMFCSIMSLGNGREDKGFQDDEYV